MEDVRSMEGLGRPRGEPLGKDTVLIRSAFDQVLGCADINVADRRIEGKCAQVANPCGKPDMAITARESELLGGLDECLTYSLPLERRLDVQTQYLHALDLRCGAGTLERHVDETDDMTTDLGDYDLDCRITQPCGEYTYGVQTQSFAREILIYAVSRVCVEEDLCCEHADAELIAWNATTISDTCV